MSIERRFLAVLIVFLVLVRFAILPPVARSLINRKLNSQPGTKGHVRSVSFQLIAGKANLEGVRAEITQGANAATIEMARLESKIHWSQLLHRNIVVDVEAVRPVVDIVARGPMPNPKTPEQIQHEVSQKLREQPRFRVGDFKVREGVLRYHDLSKKPQYELKASQINGNITNIANSKETTDTLFASFDVNALFMDSGKVHLTGKFNPIKQPPEFKLNLAMKGLELEKLNPMLTAQKDIQIKHGKLAVASEVATKNDKIDGYVKPAITDLQVSDLKKDIKKGLGHAIKEQVANLAGKLVKNHPKDQQATRVPFHGRLDDPKVSVGSAISSTLHNMFVQALVPTVEQSVSIAKTG